MKHFAYEDEISACDRRRAASGGVAAAVLFTRGSQMATKRAGDRGEGEVLISALGKK